MNNNNWGGYRIGAGRTPLDEKNRKKGIKIYVTDTFKENIIKYGIGNNLSEKAVDLIFSEIQKRRDSDKKEK